MTKDELLAIYNSPAYRSARYNYVWKDDDKAITSFWSDYESRKQRETEAALNKANAELEKKAIKEEQDAANQRQLLEDYQTASTKVANAKILLDSAVKEKGSNSADARTAKNNLSEALWFKDHIAKQLGYESLSGESLSAESLSDEPITGESLSAESLTDTATDEPPTDETPTDEVSNKAQDLANEFKVMSNPTVEKLKGLLVQIGELENQQNIAQDTKNSLADLKKSINRKIGAINKAKGDAAIKAKEAAETKEKIENALKDWRTNSKSLNLLKKHGYKVQYNTGKPNDLLDPDGNVVKETK